MNKDADPSKELEAKEEEWSNAEPDDLLLEEESELGDLTEKLEDDSTLDSLEELEIPTFGKGKNMVKAMDATQLYLSEIGFSPLLDAEEEVHYATLALQGDAAARKKND